MRTCTRWAASSPSSPSAGPRCQDRPYPEYRRANFCPWSPSPPEADPSWTRSSHKVCSECGAYKTVRPRIWSPLSGKRTSNLWFVPAPPEWWGRCRMRTCTRSPASLPSSPSAGPRSSSAPISFRLPDISPPPPEISQANSEPPHEIQL